MKIEKISDNQIKCTLTRSDLASHQLRISEIAYGTEKATGLFRDMMDKASLELGFELDDIPVSIEAIPVSMDCIILMITRLEEPEETDPDLSGMTVLKELFGKDDPDDFPLPGELSDDPSSEIFAQLENFTQGARQLSGKTAVNHACLISFRSLEDVILFARQISDCTVLNSSLYRSDDESRYYLYLEFQAKDTGAYAYVSTAALEFGRQEAGSGVRIASIKEHCRKLIEADAVRKLSAI